MHNINLLRVSTTLNVLIIFQFFPEWLFFAEIRLVFDHKFVEFLLRIDYSIEYSGKTTETFSVALVVKKKIIIENKNED